MIQTESGAGPFKKKRASFRWPIAIGVVALLIAGVIIFMERTPPGPPPATLTLLSEPAGAAVSIDGHASGVTPAQLNELHAGQVRVKLALEGYQPLDADLPLAAGAAAAQLQAGEDRAAEDHRAAQERSAGRRSERGRDAARDHAAPLEHH